MYVHLTHQVAQFSPKVDVLSIYFWNALKVGQSWFDLFQSSLFLSHMSILDGKACLKIEVLFHTRL